ncbi:ABC-2 type transport system permease protein [Prauserella aidingensis]|uniref:ABC transporter permease n=1 Tax=Prauserella aidingensis TaxID=387890 RepID=UPI0020A28722|nr:ABC transporter permease [Prauserella aidingensis]MCP2255872.1 ABC-2 type transport system permease protein [Prauserella aidingensis]
MTAAVTPPRGPGLRAWRALVAHEGRMVRRDTAGLVIPLGLPMLLLVMNGSGDSPPVPGLGGMTYQLAYVLPMVIVLTIATVGVINMPSFLATYRRYKILRRLAVTPARPSMVLVAQAVVGLAQAAAGIVLVVVAAAVLFDLSPPADPLGLAVALVLTTTAMFALGMLVAAVSPTPNAALAIGLVSFFVLMALGGGFGPRGNLPDGVATVGAHLPFGAGLDALRAAWTGGPLDIAQLGVLAGVTVVAAAVSARLFRWE